MFISPLSFLPSFLKVWNIRKVGGDEARDKVLDLARFFSVR
jgi:hypothetical protein